jgi:hypothetical protein
MKHRCAGLVVVLVSLFAFSVANADFDGVIDPRTTVTRIDSVRVVSPVQETTFLTPGWGTHALFDTFCFTGVPRWPETITPYGIVNGFPAHRPIPEPQLDTWYPIGFGVVTSYVAFDDHWPGCVEGSRPAVAPMPGLAVSPSVVTGQMTVRLQPVGTGRPVVEIHDAVGNVVRSLDCTAIADGAATATWNREDDSRHLVPEGVYFCRYSGADVIAVRRVIVAH